MTKLKDIYDSKRRKLAEEYNRKKDRNDVLLLVGNLLFWILFFSFSLEIKIYDFIFVFTDSIVINLVVYLGIILFFYELYSLLIAYYLSYRLNEGYRLIKQSVKGWIIDDLKGLILNIIVVSVGGGFFLYLTANYPEKWWIFFALGCIMFLLIVTFLFPIVLLPLFFKLEPYPAGELKERVKDFIEDIGLEIDEIYQINLSSKLNYANAAVIGLGSTRKIILGDNLLDNYSGDEIEAILAHELGHHVHQDIFKNILIQTLFIFLLSYIMYNLWPLVFTWVGYKNMYAVYTLPLILIVFLLLSWLFSPISLYFSRKFERAADGFALKKIPNPRYFASAMAKLADTSLSALEYNKYKLIFKASHPPIGERIDRALDCGGVED
ncbi:M48 family metalloprotease [Iocasia frigidifontis]|uniref:M48 family metalloprotease n=1 Tax=Iocasia fonsfrigidae TaxID=2682810 RepID=A0A8A7KHM8_9FIRM|nr:M48 family metalloprotease [Iocasia fonsfrigidae]QTL97644.1 M48 family metalloprotease [Iocasia fonsfrigidae]